MRSLRIISLIFGVILCSYKFSISQYTINSIGYAPVSGSGTYLFLDDGDVSSALPIGFTFNFFGNNYTQFYMSENGFLTFDNSGVNCCEQYIPNASSPNNLIAAGWYDLYGSEITYFTLGTSPNRTLHVDISSSNSCDGYYFEAQIILFEGSNNIEIHTSEADFTDPDYYGCPIFATQGIENSDGTVAFANSSTNFNSYYQYNDAVEFVAESQIENDIGVSFTDEFYCAGSNDIEVHVSNKGTNTALNYYLDYEIDGVPKDSIIVTDSLEIGMTDIITLENFSFTGGESYMLKVWTYNPNDSLDNNAANDTLEILLKTQLQGSLSIGSGGSDYLTIIDATDALDSFGICNDVTLSILPGTYNERINLFGLTGTSQYDITIQSSTLDSSDVIISNDYDVDNSPIFRSENNGNLLLQHITLQSTGTTCGAILRSFSNKSLTVKQVAFRGFDLASVNVSCDALYSKETSIVTIGNCTFENFSTGVQLDDRYSPNPNIKLTIDSTHFMQFSGTGIETDGVDTVSVISTQLVSSKNETSATSIGRNSKLVEFEDVEVYLDEGKYGLRCWNGSFSNLVTARNCVISLAGDSFFKYGMSISNGGSVDISHTNFRIEGTNGGRGLVLSSVSGAIHNNVFGTYAEGECLSISNNLVTSDHNLFYSQENIGFYYNSDFVSSLSDWIGASSQDSNSVYGDPGFTSFDDLHVNQTLINGRAAITTPPTSTDIDGETRNTTSPDIGADEIFSITDDIAIVDVIPPEEILAGDFSVECIVTNNSDVSVANYKIAQSINGGAQEIITVNDVLTPQAKDTITLPLITTIIGQSLSISLNTQEPNNTTDTYLFNDTLVLDTIYPLMNGTYTVGGASPDFISIEEAMESLGNSGLKDSVVFQIRSGTFLTAATLEIHPTFTCDKPIIITSESGNAADVTLNNFGLSGPVLSFLDVLGLEIKNLTIEGQDITNSKGILITGESGCLKIHDCIFNGVPISSAATGDYNIDVGFNIDSCHIYDNVITGSDYGVNIDGGSLFPVSICENNSITSRSRNINIRDSKNGKILSNELVLEGPVTNSHGIYMYNCDEAFVIDGNEIKKLQSEGGRGMYITYSSGLTASRFRISNNFVTSKFAYGIYVGANSSNVDVYHNTIRLESTIPTIYGLSFFDFTNNKAKNNVISVLGNTAYTLDHYYGIVSSLDTDYNNFYNGTGVDLVKSQTTIYDLAGWQSFGIDTNSTDLDPLFLDSLGYQVQGAHLNNMAIPLIDVPTDIEGSLRDVVTPDIGCVEFSVANDDVGIVSINYPSIPFPSGQNFAFIKFINNGLDTLTSMKVNWEVNGIPQPEYTWTGLLGSAETYDSLDIGTYDFQPYSAYSIKIWVSQPNGLPDGLAVNDTLEVFGLIPALAGDYTIGGVDPDFITLHDAANALNTGGIVDDVNFLIRAGIYADTIKVFDFSGASCDHKVTFKSEDEEKESVIISNLGYDGYPFYILNADGISIEHLTIENYSNTHPISIYAEGSSNCLNVSDNKIERKSSTNASLNAGVYRASSTNDSLVTVLNNEILGGFRGVSMTNSYSSGTVTKEVTINENIITNVLKQGIYTYYAENLDIENNQLGSSDNTKETNIHVDENSGSLVIANNKIESRGNARALYITNSAGTLANPGLVYNNFVALSTAGSNALRIGVSSYINIFNNSIYHNSTGSSVTDAPIYLTSSSFLNLYNNIAYHTNSNRHTYYFNNLTNSEIENNCYFPIHTDFAYNAATTSYLNYGDWQSQFGYDDSSINVDPDFLGPPSDLHARATQLYNSGSVVLYSATDIDGESRDTMPDIGADEFEPLPSDDAGVVSFVGPDAPFASGNQYVQIAIKNQGGNPLTSAQIVWTIDGVSQPNYTYTGNLLAGKCDTVTIGSYDFADLGAYEVLFWTEQPNGVLDSFPANDTLGPLNLYHGLIGSYTLGGSFPDFFNIGDFEDQVQYGGLLDTTDIAVRAGTYPTNLHWVDIPRVDDSFLTIASDAGDSTSVSLVPFDNNQSLVNLENVHHLIFDGLGFQHQFQKAILLSDSTNNVIFQNSHFTGKLSYGHPIIESEAEGVHHLTISNSYFKNGQNVITLKGSGAETEDGNTIDGNTFSDYTNQAIVSSNQDDIIISKNLFLTTENINPRYAVSILYGKNGYTIDANRMLLDFGAGGISISTSTLASGKSGVISNNYIHQTGNANTTGVRITSSSDFQILHNTIVNNSLNGSPITMSYHSGGVFNNNNIVSFEDGILIYSLFQQSPFVSDYNNLYSVGQIAYLYNTGQTYNTLAEWQSGTGHDMNSISQDPLFALSESATIFHPQFNDSGTSSSITTDIEGNARSISTPDLGATEFDVPPVDLRLVEVISPTDGCGLSNTETLTFLVVNQGTNTLNSVTVSYALDGSAFSSETITGLNIPSGITDTLFSALTMDLSSFADYRISAAISVAGDANLNNDTILIEITNNNAIDQDPILLYPLTSDPPTSNMVVASWTAVPLAVYYDLYFWLDATTVVDTITNIPANTSFINDLLQDTIYQYYVEAFDNCGNSTTSDTSGFTVEALPDIFVSSVSAPTTAFNNSAISVSWVVENDTEGSTGMKSWNDVIYLSEDATFNPSVDISLGSSTNTSALIGIDNYIGNKTVTLPGLTIGAYYLLIISDRYDKILEEDETNNVGYSAQKILIETSPHVDFLPTTIAVPAIQFNNDTLYYSWTVSNVGDAPTTSADLWRDYLYLSHDSLELDVAMVLEVDQISEIILPDSSLTISGQKYIPASTLGDFWIHLDVDRFNKVFEFTSEGNNSRVSDKILFINPPLPDLVHLMHTLPDTVDSYEIINATVIFKNNGLSDVLGYFDNRFYQGISPIFNTNYLALLQNKGFTQDIKPDSIATLNYTWRVPGNVVGDRYFYHALDLGYGAGIIESDEENNVLQKVIYVRAVDAAVSNFTFPSSAMANSTLGFMVDLINTGDGDFYGQSYKLGVYISDMPIYDEQATLLYTKSYNISSQTGDTLSLSGEVDIPYDQGGNKYTHVVFDREDQILESDESNNVLSQAVTIFDSGTKDLTVTPTSIPDTIYEGQTYVLNYDLQNIGAIPHDGATNVTIYMSPEAMWNINNATFLAVNNVTNGINENGSPQSTFVSIPAFFPSNTVYFYFWVDPNGLIQEENAEDNNIVRSDAVELLAQSTVDVAITNVTLDNTTPASNSFISSQVHLNRDLNEMRSENIDITFHLLSNETGGQDYTLETNTVNWPTGTTSLVVEEDLWIPAFATGDYVLEVIADTLGKLAETNLLNNIYLFSPSLSISEGQSADLTFTSITTPSEAQTGKSISFVFEVDNIGTADAVNYQVGAYLSTDYVLDEDDLSLGFVTVTSHSTNELKTDTINSVISSAYEGSFVLIFKADAQDAISEINSEDNNLSFHPILLELPPPADLVVGQVSNGDTLNLGDVFMVEYTITNVGAEPAIGVNTDQLYLSKDGVLDVSDILLCDEQYGISLAPNQSVTRSRPCTMKGVLPGEVFILVETNTRNFINETNVNNNFGLSDPPLIFEIEEIEVDDSDVAIRESNQAVFYKLFVDPVYAGETVQVDVYSPNESGFVTSYMSYEAMPTEFDQEYIGNDPFQALQRMYINAAEPGDYYILCKGEWPGGVSDSLQVDVSYQPMKFDDVQPSIGIQGTVVTTRVEGAGLTNMEYFRLRNDSLVINHHAATFEEISPNLTYVTFDLDSLPLDVYDYDGVKNTYDLAFMPQYFSVINDEVDNSLSFTITGPSSTFGGQTIVPLLITWENTGNVDLVNPSLMVSAPGGNILAQSIEELENGSGTNELILYPQEAGGPANGIVRPGANGTIHVVGYAGQAPLFTLERID